MIADACNFACDYIYDETFGWIKNGSKHPTLYITTEARKRRSSNNDVSFLSANSRRPYFKWKICWR